MKKTCRSLLLLLLLLLISHKTAGKAMININMYAVPVRIFDITGICDSTKKKWESIFSCFWLEFCTKQKKIYLYIYDLPFT